MPADAKITRVAHRAACAMLAASVCAATPVLAQPVAARGAWVQAPAPGQADARVYLELTGYARYSLLAVASPAAARAELRATVIEDGIARTRRVDRVPLPPGETVRLAPGGLHAVLVELRRPLRAGERVPLTLTLQRADFSRVVFTVAADVRAFGEERAPPARFGGK